MDIAGQLDRQRASAGSTLTSTGSWIQGASGNISNSNSNNAFKTLTIAGTGVTTTLTGNVDVGNNIGSSLTIGPGTLYGGNWGLYFYPYSNDSLTVNNPIVGSSLDSFQFSNERSITQKAITLPNNFGSVYLRNDNGNLVATGNFNFGNNPLIFWATQTGTPTYYTDMGSYALTSGALTIGRTGSLDGFLKLGTSASHSIASIAVTSGAGTGNILDLGSSTTAVSGNVNLTGICLGSCITPTAGTSTITLSGGSGQTITSNSNPFNILTVTNSSAGGITFADRLQTATLNDTTDGSTLKFSAATAGARHTISSAMNITGGASKITLAPSVAATTWYLTAPTPTTATNVIVSYSNSSGHITPVTSTDGGNNLNWDFDTTPPTLATGVNPATLSYDNTASTVDIASAGTCADAGSGMNATQPYQVSYSDVGTSADTSCSSKSYTIGTAWGTSHATSFAGTDGHYYCVKLECKDAASTPNTSAFYSANNILYDITAPTISIGSSSASLTNTGPVTYTITYGGADAVTLANGNVTLNKTGTANGTAVVSGTGLTTRTVTISGITGDGTLGISIASGTASDNAGNTALAGGPSGTFSVDNTAPSAPTSLSWQETSPHNAVSVNSSWVKSSSGDLADQKIQFYSDDSCGATSGSLIDLSSSSLQTRAFTGTDGNTYTYKITSVDNAGNQTVSACSGAMMIDTSAPTGSGIFSISADSDSQLTVTADTPVDSKAGLDSAPYQFEETSGNHGADSSGWQTSSSYTDSGLSPNTEYIYKVRAKDSIGNTSGYSDTSSKYTLSAVPGLPSLTADTSAQITANWSANGNPTGTEFYIENMINSTNSGWITGTSWTSSNLACGTNYSFRVRARNADHTNSDYSATVDKTTNGCGGAGMIIGANNPPSSSPVISTNNGVVSAVTNIANQVATIVNKLSLPAGRQAPITETVPKETPESLNGLKIMSVNPLGKFAISPIQSDIAFFANKLPQLKKALDALAINANKAEDVKKLSQTQLYLPGLTQTILSPKEILQANKVANVSPTPKAGLSPAPQKELAKANLQANALAATKGIPLAQLSSASVAKMPSNLVFARTAGELVDFTSALSVDSKGNVQQKNNDYFRKANGAGD
ncbi:MAG: hypothetical protein NT155_02150 [Candidatus Staskawiczbacteria bacterium]|nr:hypothetical protein [Candidatus Staskawiczbacteria bacterium]